MFVMVLCTATPLPECSDVENWKKSRSGRDS
jgi:hypothetical protein